MKKHTITYQNIATGRTLDITGPFTAMFLFFSVYVMPVIICAGWLLWVSVGSCVHKFSAKQNKI